MKLKNSVGIWAFGANATRFMPKGYHSETSVVSRAKNAVNGLKELVDGFEFHYPNEINENNVKEIKRVLGSKDVYCLALGTFSDPKFKDGAFINPNKKLREENLKIAKEGIDLAAELKSNFIIWPGGEGYNYPFQANYSKIWDYFIHGIQIVAEYAQERGVTIFLEHKNSEPAMNILMRNIGMAIFVIRKIQQINPTITNLKINMDWQHLIMNGENLAEYAVLLSKEGLLGHQHSNSGWGTFDDDNITGALCFMRTLELATTLQELNYGSNGERIGFDLFPYTENQVDAVKRAIIQWEFIWDLAKKINKEDLHEARNNKDAIRGQEIVYSALGLDNNFLNRLINSKK